MSFLASRFAPYVAILVVAVALYAKGWWDGHASAMEAWQATQATADRVSLEATLGMARKGSEETVRYVTRTKVVHDEIEKLVPVVTPADDARCVLPADFAGMWNRVNAATNPAAADPIGPAHPAVIDDAQAAGRGAPIVRR